MGEGKLGRLSVYFGNVVFSYDACCQCNKAYCEQIDHWIDEY